MSWSYHTMSVKRLYVKRETKSNHVFVDKYDKKGRQWAYLKPLTTCQRSLSSLFISCLYKASSRCILVLSAPEDPCSKHSSLDWSTVLRSNASLLSLQLTLSHSFPSHHSSKWQRELLFYFILFIHLFIYLFFLTRCSENNQGFTAGGILSPWTTKKLITHSFPTTSQHGGTLFRFDFWVH